MVMVRILLMVMVMVEMRTWMLMMKLLMAHCYIKCPFLGLGAYFGQFSSNGISFHHELMFAMGLEF